MDKLALNEKYFWEKYLSSLAEDQRPKNPHIEASYAGNKEITDDLVQLYLAGKKVAGSSIVEDFLSAGDPLPKIGNYWIVLDSSRQPRCVAKTIKTVTHKFKDVPVEIAIAEGEGDSSLQYWRKTHSELYTPHLRQWGIENIEDATVITEFFEVTYDFT